MKWRSLIMVWLAIASAVASPWAPDLSNGTSQLLASQNIGKAKLKPFFYGAATCNDLKCHDNPMAAKAPGANIILCDYDEYQKWSTQDKHSLANLVLKGDRAKQIARLLDIKGDVSREPMCIACHGVWIKDENMRKQAEEGTFKLEEGVSCGACHGYYYEWNPVHSAQPKRKEWRKTSRQEKQDHFGMTDLWNPEIRAKVCASCHIGNVEEGKVVTHAMYAAGHPLLPGIEMASFSDAMPRHWKYLREKTPEVQKIVNYDAAATGLEHTQLVVVGGLVAFRESMRLLEAQAKQHPDAADPQSRWPEFAAFDCAACHHDLALDSWRQRRPLAGKVPGRPPMRSWSTALVRLAIIRAGNGDADRTEMWDREFNSTIDKLTVAFSAKPFGDPADIKVAAKEAITWADHLLSHIRVAKFDTPMAHRLLSIVAAESKRTIPDFDSARQLGWAFRAIQFELRPELMNSANGAPVSKLLNSLDHQLSLTLPKGRTEIVKAFLAEYLDKSYKYEPASFQRTMDQLIRSSETKAP